VHSFIDIGEYKLTLTVRISSIDYQVSLVEKAFDIKNVSRLLSSCSNNLNQYVRLAHETGSIYETDIKDLNERLTEVTIQFKKILKGFVKVVSIADDGV